MCHAPTFLPRQARYATFRAAGLSRVAAASQAGYKGADASLKVTAARLERRRSVRAEMARYAQADRDAAIVTRREALAFLSRIMRFDFCDILDINSEGKCALDVRKAVRALGNGLLSSLTIRKDGGFSVSTDKFAALQVLGKLEGWLNGPPAAVELAGMSDHALELHMLEMILPGMIARGWYDPQAHAFTPAAGSALDLLLSRLRN